MVCFTMTINKSQEQSLSYIEFFCQSLSLKKGLKILILDENKNLCNTMKNVYQVRPISHQ